jgi:hypothetical protein
MRDIAERFKRFGDVLVVPGLYPKVSARHMNLRTRRRG